MSEKILIIGAGMAGLLAGNMLRRLPLQIVEKQSKLPNNHHGVLRFRTTAVSDQTHIPFKRVRVFKEIEGDYGPIAAAMLYSRKVIGRYQLRSILSLDPCERYVAPSDFISRMADGLDIAYGVDGLEYCKPERREELGPVISTLPMPLLMDATGYDGERPDFEYCEGWSATMSLGECEAFATIYFPAPDTNLYRASITGNKLNCEFIGRPSVDQARSAMLRVLPLFGLDVTECMLLSIDVKESKYAKLAELDEAGKRKAKDFMFWATNRLNIFSLGRFATWRHNLLLDDIVNDVMMIERWISAGSYELQKSR